MGFTQFLPRLLQLYLRSFDSRIDCVYGSSSVDFDRALNLLFARCERLRKACQFLLPGVSLEHFDNETQLVVGVAGFRAILDVFSRTFALFFKPRMNLFSIRKDI